MAVWKWWYKSIYMLVFFTIFFIKRPSFKRFNLYMKLLQSSTVSKQKKIIMMCLAIKSFAWNFLQLPIKKKKNCNSTHSYNRKIWVDIPPCIIFPLQYKVLFDKFATQFEGLKDRTCGLMNDSTYRDPLTYQAGNF